MDGWKQVGGRQQRRSRGGGGVTPKTTTTTTTSPRDRKRTEWQHHSSSSNSGSKTSSGGKKFKHEVVVVNLPTTTTFRNVFALACRLAGESNRPVSVQVLRNKTTQAPLGCALVSCKNRQGADAIAEALDGYKLGRNRLSARSDLRRLGTVRVRCEGSDVDQIRPILEQCGTLVDVRRRDDFFLATYADGASAVAAEAVLDWSVLHSTALRVELYEEADDAESEEPPSPHPKEANGGKRRTLLVPRTDIVAPRDVDTLMPLSFQCGGEEWKAGVWADVKAVCEMTSVPMHEVDVAATFNLVVVAAPSRESNSLLTVSLKSRDAVEVLKAATPPCRLFLFSDELDHDDDDDASSPLRFVFEAHTDDESCGSTTQVATEHNTISSEDKESAFEAEEEDDDLGKKAHETCKSYSLSVALLQMWERGIATDCAITCDDGCDVVRAHRAVLAARSAFFYRHFVDRQGYEKVCLNAEPSRIVRALCCFAYANALVGSHAEIIQHARDAVLLLDAASRYEVYGLADYVTGSLRPSLHFVKHDPITSNHALSVCAFEKLQEETKALYHDAADAEPELAKYYFQYKQTPRLRAKVKANISRESLVDLFQFAAAIPSDTLKQDCLAYAKVNIQTVMAQQDFTNYLQNRSDLVFDLLATINN